jgi:diketogulonate reductase-like aldo/keto reductase
MMDIPNIGFGTYKLNGSTEKSVSKALKNGYRHIDTATAYRHEIKVGSAIRKSGIDRKEIFVTTKIPWWHIEKLQIEEAANHSLKELDIQYIDLILLHMPFEGLITKSWQKMEDMYRKLNKNSVKVRYIGVCNYNVIQLKELLNGCKIKPYCNQFEISPFLTRPELTQFCKDNDIIITAHSSVTKGLRLDNKTLCEIAEKHNKTSAQILLKWGLTKGYNVIPMAKREDFMIENLDMDFMINDQYINKLDELNDGFATHPKLLKAYTCK